MLATPRDAGCAADERHKEICEDVSEMPEPTVMARLRDAGFAVDAWNKALFGEMAQRCLLDTVMNAATTTVLE